MVLATIANRLIIGLPHVQRRKLLQRNHLIVIATIVVQPIIGLAHVQRRKLLQRNQPMFTATAVDRLIIGYQPVLIKAQNSQMKQNRLFQNNLPRRQKLRRNETFAYVQGQRISLPPQAGQRTDQLVYETVLSLGK